MNADTTVQNKQERMIGVVRGLLNKTIEQGCTQAEAEAAAEKAAELLTLYNISVDMLNASAEKADAKIVQEIIRYTEHWQDMEFFQFRVDLSSTLARYMYCRILLRAQVREIVYLGRPTDISVVVAMHNQLEQALRQIRRVEEAEFRRNGGTNKDIGPWRRAFYAAALREIDRRLHDKRRELEQSHVTVTALVVKTDTQINDFIKETYGKIGRAYHRRQRSYHRDGFESGRRAGQRVDLGGDRQVGQSSARGLLNGGN